MERSETSPDDFLATLDGDIRSTMSELDGLITVAMPGCSRTLWTGVFWGGTEQRIIGYGDLVQTRSKGPDVEWFMVGLARQKKHYSLYVNAVEDGAYLLHQYADRLGNVKIGSANVSFASSEALDHAALTELLERAHFLAAG